MCTLNQLEKNAKSASVHGRRHESSEINAEKEKKGKMKSLRDFEKKKTKDKKKHKKRENGDLEFGKMKLSKKQKRA